MEPNFNAADAGEEDACSRPYSFRIMHLAPRIPFRISFQFPFSRNRINIGKESLGRLRKRTRLDPEEAVAHITLAAHLLSEKPLLATYAEEAAQQLQMALGLMPLDKSGHQAQGQAMIHKFLGDALNVLGKRSEARRHWEQAVALDPVAPPYGFSGPAQEMLNKYPA